jgi:ABC-type transporter Mla subunit MlaD
VLDKVVGSVAPLVRLPVTLVTSIEGLITELGSVAARAGAVLDAIEGMPARVEKVLAVAEPAAARVEALVTRAESVPDRIDVVLDQAAALTARIETVLKKAETITRKVDGVVGDAAATLKQVQPAVEALGAVEPGLITSLVEEAAQGVPLLLDAVEHKLLPALAQLEQLVPVVEHLGEQVDHLDATVADVGAMLGGIPGAARLLKRGTAPKA